MPKYRNITRRSTDYVAECLWHSFHKIKLTTITNHRFTCLFITSVILAPASALCGCEVTNKPEDSPETIVTKIYATQPYQITKSDQEIINIESPLEFAVSTLPVFEGKNRTIEVNYDSLDDPTTASVTILEEGYIDDSIKDGYFKFDFEVSNGETWIFIGAQEAWSCRRSEDTNFDVKLCP